ncbi:MAG: hypothetical protein M1415_00720 [Firmicutes bacterium]|nr:hypothetical protein [Bacillota bacterium]
MYRVIWRIVSIAGLGEVSQAKLSILDTICCHWFDRLACPRIPLSLRLQLHFSPN